MNIYGLGILKCLYCFCVLFYVRFKNISRIWRRHHYRCRTPKWRPMIGTCSPWAKEIFIVGNTCWDSGPRFLRSYPKDCPNIVVLNIKHGYWGPTCILPASRRNCSMLHVEGKCRRRYNHKMLQLNTILLKPDLYFRNIYAIA